MSYTVDLMLATINGNVLSLRKTPFIKSDLSTLMAILSHGQSININHIDLTESNIELSVLLEVCQIIKIHPRINSLDLSGNNLNNEDIITLVQLLLTLEIDITYLRLDRNNVGNSGLEALATVPSLRILSVRDNSITAISPLLCQSTILKQLYLDRNNIGDSIHLFENNSSLHTLSLRGCQIKASQLEAIARNTTLRNLCLAENKFGDDGAEKLTTTQIPALDCTSCGLTNAGVITLLVNRNFRKLELDLNDIDNDVLPQFTQNNTLASVSLGGNHLTDDHTEALFTHASLVNLNFYNNYITSALALLFIGQNSIVTDINLYTNHLDTEMEEKVCAKADANKRQLVQNQINLNIFLLSYHRSRNKFVQDYIPTKNYPLLLQLPADIMLIVLSFLKFTEFQLSTKQIELQFRFFQSNHGELKRNVTDKTITRPMFSLIRQYQEKCHQQQQLPLQKSVVAAKPTTQANTSVLSS